MDENFAKRENSNNKVGEIFGQHLPTVNRSNYTNFDTSDFEILHN